MSAPNVHILVTCRKEELKEFSFLVFKTLHIGFPTAKVHVYDNALPDAIRSELLAICQKSGYHCSRVETIHHNWISSLLEIQSGPFVICDTDVIFYSKVEDWKFDTAIAGAYTPEWQDNLGNITRSRLHTSLMYIDPAMVRNQTAGYLNPHPLSDFMPPLSPIDPVLLSFNRRRYFHDTCSQLFHLIGGTQLTAQQKDCFFHFNMGTISDLVMPLLDDPAQMQRFRDEIISDPQQGRGQWRECDKYYADRPARYDGKDVIAKIEPEDSAVALEWNRLLCMGDENAMKFCDLWYGYVHGIDDLIDTSQDGRPSMSKRQMISLFFHAALLYNSTFYKANQVLLFPLILDITSSYTTSVEWETSPYKHRRELADHMRMAGSRMYGMVALIVGGEAHSQEMSQRIHEQDWTRQHSPEGYPI